MGSSMGIAECVPSRRVSKLECIRRDNHFMTKIEMVSFLELDRRAAATAEVI